MNDCLLTYELNDIDNLRYLLCVVQDIQSEQGMRPISITYRGHQLTYDSFDAAAVLKGRMDEEEYIRHNEMSVLE